MKILEITNLTKVYKNNHKALNNINLSINKGEFIALLGENGAGKSTLINIIADIVTKTDGSIKASGFDFDTDRLEFKRRIGIVTQDLNLDLFFTAFELLKLQQGLYGLPYNEKKILDLLEIMELSDKRNSYPRDLSGGMKRRLLIAKALIHDPEIIILDEPTAGVDVRLRQQLWELLKTLNNSGKTIILTTHYLEEAQHLCEKIAIIDKGNLLHYDNKDSLINQIGSRALKLELDKTFNEEDINFNHRVLETPNIISVDYENDTDVGNIVQEVLKKGYSIKKMSMLESTLEDVYLKLLSK